MVMNGDSLRLPATGLLELAVDDGELVGQYHLTVDMEARQSKRSIEATGVVEGQTLHLTLRRPNADVSLDWEGLLSSDSHSLPFPSDPGRGFPQEWNRPIVFRHPGDK